MKDKLLISVVDYKPEHLEKIVLKDIHEGERPKKISTKALTLMRDGVPIAIFGAIWLGKSVIHIWGLVSEEVKKAPLEFFRTCRKLLRWLESEHQVHRFQMDIRLNYLGGAEFAEALKFKREGIMTKFGSDGTDRYLYGRTV